MSETMIQVVDVTHHYGVRPVLRDISLTVASTLPSSEALEIVDEHVTLNGPENARDHTDKRALTHTVGPHQREQFAAIGRSQQIEVAPGADQARQTHPAVRRVTAAVLAAWLVFCWVTSALREDRHNDLTAVGLVTGFLLLAAAIRLIVYSSNYRSPISGWGRVRTLRLIIPGYDRALVAPLAALAISILAPLICWEAERQYPLVLAVATLLMVSLVFNAGPKPGKLAVDRAPPNDPAAK